MKLGLLSESGQNVARIREQATYVSFGHKLLQEWAGAYYIVKRLERTTDIQGFFWIHVVLVKQMGLLLVLPFKSMSRVRN